MLPMAVLRRRHSHQRPLARGRKRRLRLEHLEPRRVLDSTVVINEIMYNPAGTEETLEWIELHNQMAVDMDLSGWALSDGVQFTFAAGTVVPGEGYLVIAADPAALLASTGFADALGPLVGRLANGGEQIELVDNNARVMSVVDYGDSGRWPVGPDGSGATLAKVDQGSSSELASNWATSARVGGTPGAENFPAADTIALETTLVELDGPWKYDDSGVDLGAAWRQAGFDDTGWSSGNGLFFDGPAALPGPKNTTLTTERTTYYFRSEFDFSGDPANTRLELDHVLDDGAVFYLNNAEALRVNMPDGPVVYDTLAATEIGVAESSGTVIIPADNLAVGTNVLAVEVHQAAETADPDAVPIANWSFEADPPHPLTGPTGWTATGINTAGNTRVTFTEGPFGTGGVATTVPYPDGTQALGIRNNDGGAMSIHQDVGPIGEGTYELSFSVADRTNEAWLNYRVELLAVDALGVETTLIAEDSALNAAIRPTNGSTSHPSPWTGAEGDWLNVVLNGDAGAGAVGQTLRVRFSASAASAGDTGTGTSNDFALDAVSLSFASATATITYDAAFGAQLVAEETLPQAQIVDNQVLAIDATWRYDDAGVDRGTAWRDVGFDDSAWSTGDALFFDTDAELPAAKNTPLAPGVNAYYFRAEFQHDSGAVAVDAIRLRPIIDDGAAFYLNGQEVYRYNMPDGPIAFDTFATAGVPNAGLLDPILLPADALADGLNVLAVEVHQVDPTATSGGQLLLDAGNGSLRDYNGTVGFTFTTVDSSMTIDELGFFDHNLDGFVGSHEVGLWNAGGTLLGSVVLQAGTANVLDGEYRWAGLSTPITLDPSTQYYIGARVGNGDQWRDQTPFGSGNDPTVNTLIADPSSLDSRFTSGVFGFPGSIGTAGTTFGPPNLRGGPPAIDAAFGTEMVVQEIVTGAGSVPLAINEVDAGGGGTFTLELVNHGAQPIDLGGYVLTPSTDGAVPYVFPAETSPLPGGGFLQLNETALGFVPAAGDKVFLGSPDGMTVLDAVVVDDVLRGRYPDGTGPWRFPDQPTPGGANLVTLHDEIVINEIMYHHRPNLGTTDVPAMYETTTLMQFDALWRYNDAGDALPSEWHETTHAVGGNWQQGSGLIGFETTPAALPEPIGTQLADPTTNTPFIVTYYFETDFSLTSEQLGSLDALHLQHIIDDGAVFYVNGQEIDRFNIPEGPVTSATLASPGVGNATLSGVVEVAKELLVAGTNRLSVEVHQQSTGSSDIVFGVQLAAVTELTPAIPGEPFAEDPEEWIELFNRGSTVVDLTGWQLKDAVRYDFAPGMSLAPGEYLVVAKDLAALQAKYPTLTNIVGPFDRSLSNNNERILLDDAAGNPADEVHYFDGGRWDGYADGAGPSLELRNPDGDNSKGEAWAASDEASKSNWQTYTRRGVAETTIPGSPSLWQEFALGLLDGAGEVLLDNISVVEDPDGAAIELIQNGSFDDGTAAHWRLLGNHQRSEVVDDNGNLVLHLISSGATEYQGNQIETTLGGGAVIADGREYEISFDAKWLTGSRQVNSRLYSNRLAQTTFLEVPENNGTPGMANSRSVANIGPTYNDLRHSPTTPQPNEPVTVSLAADDPDGVASLSLRWRADGDAWSSTPMTPGSGNAYAATIPGMPAGTVVQFYVEGHDALGAASTFPAAGPDSRALVVVADGQALDGSLHNFRVIMLQADADHMHLGTNSLSNERLGATVVYQDEVFYDVGIRLKGSFVGRDAARVGFNIAFNSDQLFRGVHDKVAVDRSTHGNLGVDEILVKHLANQAGAIPSMYDDLVHFIGARPEHTNTASLRMAGFDELYLDSQFDNGADGTVYEYEVIRWATTTVDGDPESLKRAGGLDSPNGYAAVAIQDLGDDKEDYRWSSLIVNNRTRDDYDSIIALGKAMSLSGAALDEASRATMDVDEWMRVLAFQSLVGPGDAGGIHNFRLYARPGDGRVLYMPWDWDSAFMRSTTSNVVEGYFASQIVSMPTNLRAYYGHLDDIIDTSFNTTYMSAWTDHYGELGGQNFGGRLSYIGQRAGYVTGQLPATFGFALTTSAPLDVGLNSSATLQGRAWIDVRELRLAGSDQPLDVTWITDQQTAWADGWEVTIPVQFGTHSYTIEAYDFQGDLVDSVPLDITSTLSSRPVQDFLRVSEIMYHPANPTVAEQAAGFLDDDDFEFIELVNKSESQSLDLGGVSFTDGINFTIGDGMSLPPGERALLVRNSAAFAVRYDTAEMNILGEYRDPISGGNKLDNGGETLMLVDADAALVQLFTYNDGNSWPQQADGDGSSLEVVNFASDYDLPTTWYDSPQLGGSPGQVAAAAVLDRLGFYDVSAYDTITDDDAIAPDKQALMPGQVATAANYTNCDRGINGVIVDMAWPADRAALSAGDFTFLVGNNDDPNSWTPAAAPDVTVVEGAGRGGSDRVYLSWPTGAPTNTWLQVTARSDMPNTGLAADDVFYFGNAAGETGNDPSNALVTAADVIAIRDNPRGPGNRADITTPHDINRDQVVDATDTVLARNHATGPFDGLRLITPPLPVPVPPEAEGERMVRTQRVDAPAPSGISRPSATNDRETADEGGERLRRNWQLPPILLREQAALAPHRPALSTVEEHTRALGRQSTEMPPEQPFTDLDEALDELLSVARR